MGLREFFQAVRHSPNVTWASFRIDPEHVLDEVGLAPETDRFVAERTYLELRLLQMHLRDRRDYWQDFRPLGSFAVELLYDGSRRSVPIVVGPDLLEKCTTVGGKTDGVEYTNIRLAGPYPYVGDDVELFAGLYRLEAGNWAKSALSLLEVIGQVFDPTRLSTFVSVSAPLVDTVQRFLGMSEVEARLVTLRQFSQPPDEVPNGWVAPATTLHPGYEVWLRLAEETVDAAAQNQFWVREGRLWTGKEGQPLVPFREADFLLLRTIALTGRGDFTTFGFHRDNWPQITEAIWNGQPEEAERHFRILATELAESKDITRPHRGALLVHYRNAMTEESEQYERVLAGSAQPFEGAGTSAAVDEISLQAVVIGAGQTPGDGSPSALLSMVGL